MRRHQRAEITLAWIQLSLLCPGRWPSITALANDLGIDKASIGRVIGRLENLGLIQLSSLSKRSTVWLWWVKKFEGDCPSPLDEPFWQIADLETGDIHEIPVSQRYAWADRHRISARTFNDFIAKRQEVLYGKWKIVKWP